MENKEYIPRLRRDVELYPTHYQGTSAIIAKDSLGLIQNPILLQGDIVGFISLIDGRRNMKDLQLEFMRMKRGILVSSEEIKSFILELDSAFLLDSDRYHQERDRIISEYSLLEVRTAFHAGRSYPAEPGKLRSYLESILNIDKANSLPLRGQKVIALISPHIDMEAGKKVYARAYQAVRHSNPQRIILLGTGHSLQEAFLSLTEKDYQTPLGRVKTDKVCVKSLKEAGLGVIASSDIAHRSEHSLEFQLVFLQHLFGSNFSCVPLLCGSFRKMLEHVSRPSEIPGMENVLESLRHAVADCASETLLVAGVDFSHIGPKFGHREHARSMLLETRNHDKLLIDAICKGNVVDFWTKSRKARDKYNVCGFSALACLLEVIGDVRGYLLDYEVWEEEPTQSAVSFAAIAFKERSEGG